MILRQLILPRVLHSAAADLYRRDDARMTVESCSHYLDTLGSHTDRKAAVAACCLPCSTAGNAVDIAAVVDNNTAAVVDDGAHGVFRDTPGQLHH